MNRMAVEGKRLKNWYCKEEYCSRLPEFECTHKGCRNFVCRTHAIFVKNEAREITDQFCSPECLEAETGVKYQVLHGWS